MKSTHFAGRVFAVVLVFLGIGIPGRLYLAKVLSHQISRVVPAVEAAPATQQHEQKVQAAVWETAKVFGRAPGCQDADPELGRMAAEAALAHEIDPKIVAATIAVESGCNTYATSVKGAIGLMQVMPSIWKTTYDFQGKVNLLNRQDNIKTGTDILAGYIKKYGKSSGVTHYQGTGTGCPTCDGAYTSKILKLADGK